MKICPEINGKYLLIKREDQLTMDRSKNLCHLKKREREWSMWSLFDLYKDSQCCRYVLIKNFTSLNNVQRIGAPIGRYKGT